MIYRQILLVLEKSGETILNLWPYVAGGVLLGEILRYTSWTDVIDRACRRSLPVEVTVAALLGMASSLCTYGTVPLVLRLLAAGVHPAPLVTFLCASSLFNPQIFIITWGGIDLEMALVRTGVTLLISLCLGFLLLFIPKRLVVWAGAAAGSGSGDEWANPAAERTEAQGGTGVQEESGTQERTGAQGGAGSPVAAGGSRKKDRPSFPEFLRGFWQNLEYVGFYLLLGVLLGSLVEVVVPSSWFSHIFSGSRWFSVLAAAGLGVPLYACGGGVIPFIRALLEQGLSRGAALTFFLVGPATRITPLMALAAVLRPLFLVLYVVVLVILAVAAGLLYN